MINRKAKYVVLIHSETEKTKVVYCETDEEVISVVRMEERFGRYDNTIWKNIDYCDEDYIV